MRALVVLLAGCNQLYGLGPTGVISETDSDDDGIIDARDNCPLVANSDQRDEDGDSVGDVCDNCPFIANAQQEAIGDGDALGDLCDPHAAVDGDCLLVQDTFTDPGAFADHWQVISNEVAPQVHASPGEVSIEPILFAGGIAVVARDGVPLGERLDVVAVGRLDHVSPDSTVEVGAVTNVAAIGDGFRCDLMNGPNGLGVASQAPGTVFQPQVPLSAVPIGDALVLRVATEIRGGNVQVRCRIAYGLAAGAYESPTGTLASPPGSAGVLTTHDPLVLEAIAISRFQPGEPCPPTIVR